MTLLQLFYRYLKQNHAYHLFLYNICNRKHKSSWHYNIENITKHKAFFLISNAFTWRETKEGHSFWLEINNRWEQIILYYAKNLSRYETLESLTSNREIKLNDELIKILKV